MPLTKSKFRLLVCSLFILAACKFTTTKIKDPVFFDEAKLESELSGVINSENVNLNGAEMTTNGKTTSELEIDIINGKNIPTNDDERKMLGKTIAKSIKGNLKDPNEFDSYRVLFVTRLEKGDMTKRNWVGNVFSSREL